MQYTIENTDIPYTIRHSSKAIHARIVLKMDHYEIVLPNGIEETYAHQFAQRKKAWMQANLINTTKQAEPFTPRQPFPKSKEEMNEIKRLLKKEILSIISKYHETLGRPNQLKLKFMTSRWGSLTHKKTMNINIALAFAPTEVLEYVVVHELCHLTHMNHSRDFWALVANSTPSYKKYELWLKKNSQRLFFQVIDFK